jgi:cytochrome c-type biogenesis protein
VSLELAAIPLAFVAGVVGILSPCIWPLVPVVMSSAKTGGWRGPLYLALGLSLAFAVAGTFLTLLLLNLGLNPDAYRHLAALLLVLVALMFLVRPFGDWVANKLSRLTGRAGGGPGSPASPVGQLGVGALLGFVWLPCVGPTLGAAIALASLGQQMGQAFLVMFTFGAGTALALLLASFGSVELLQRLRPGLMAGAVRARQVLGVVLLVLGLMVLTGIDKSLEAQALQLLPRWVYSL